MAIPEGYTQLASGFWTRDEDAASPFVFDGANMTLLAGISVTDTTVATRTSYTFDAAETFIIDLTLNDNAVPCTTFVYPGSGDSILVESSDSAPSGPFTEVVTVNDGDGWTAIFSDQATKAIQITRTAGSSTDSLVINSQEMIVYPEPSPAVAAGTSRDLSMADDGTLIVATAGITLTIPLGLATTFNCEIVLASAGTVTVTGASGVTVNGSDGGSKSLTVLDGSIRVVCRTTNNYAAIV